MNGELIDLVGLTGREKSYPSQLSGGQKAKSGLPTCVVTNQKSHVMRQQCTSPKTTKDILKLLVEINRLKG